MEEIEIYTCKIEELDNAKSELFRFLNKCVQKSRKSSFSPGGKLPPRLLLPDLPVRDKLTKLIKLLDGLEKWFQVEKKGQKEQ